jgi:serine protease Do
MKSFSLAAAGATALLVLTAGFQVSAQQKREKQERIIIEKKEGKQEKMIIEIDGDKVTINGKPVSPGDSNIVIRKFKKEDVIVRVPQTPRIEAMPYGPMEPRGGRRYEFRRNDQEWKRFGEEWKQWGNEFQKEFNNRAVLGVVTDENEKGAVVKEVREGTAAAAAGLKEGDVITKVGETPITSPEQLAATIRKQQPGDEVSVTYLRDGKKKTARAKLGNGASGDSGFRFTMPEMPAMPDIKLPHELHWEYLNPWNAEGFKGQMQWFHNRPRLGATIQDVQEGNGVKVLNVDGESAAEQGGLKKDDIIVEINGKPVQGVDEARELLREKNEKGSWTIKVLRDGKPLTLDVKVPKDLKKADL